MKKFFDWPFNADPEVRYTQNTTPVANFRIAVRRIRKTRRGPKRFFIRGVGRLRK